MNFFRKQPQEIKPGVLRESRDGFIQELTPEMQEKLRQSIIRVRESQARTTDTAMRMMQEYPEMAGTIMSVLCMFGGSSANFESVAELRWGVTVPPATESPGNRDSTV
jgi:hypothetical protein